MIFGGLYGSNWQSSSSVYSSALAQSSALYAQQIAQCQAALGAHPLDQSQLAALLAFSDEIAPSKPIEDTGIELGEVIAWRAWKIQHGWLYSMVANEEWEPGEIKKAHKISEVLGDGIHAFKRRIDAANYCTQPGSIVGQVALWGTIYEFEKGCPMSSRSRSPPPRPIPTRGPARLLRRNCPVEAHRRYRHRAW